MKTARSICGDEARLGAMTFVRGDNLLHAHVVMINAASRVCAVFCSVFCVQVYLADIQKVWLHKGRIPPTVSHRSVKQLHKGRILPTIRSVKQNL